MQEDKLYFTKQLGYLHKGLIKTRRSLEISHLQMIYIFTLVKVMLFCFHSLMKLWSGCCSICLRRLSTMSRIWPYGGRGRGRSSSSRGEDTSTPRADPSTPRTGPSTPRTGPSTSGARPTSGAVPSTSGSVLSTHIASSSASIDELESRNVRGIANPEQIPKERKRTEIIGNDFSNDHAIHHMNQINRSLVTSAWCTWTQIPKETKTLMWERFQSYYCWDSTLDGRILQIWETKSLKNYNDGMNAARTKAGKLAVNDERPYRDDDPHRDMNLLKDFPPPWLTKSIWGALIDQWNNDHWKTVSKKSSNNRMTKIDGEISKHTNGSISTSRHAERLKKARKGVPPTWGEVFDYTHRKRLKSTSSSLDGGSLGDYVTPRDGRVAGTYKGDVNQKYGEDATSHPIIDEALWKQASETSEGSKKGRIYGFGNTSDPNLVLTGVLSGGYASGASPSDTRIQALEARLQQSEEAREKDLEEMRRQEEARMKEMEEIRQIEEVRKEHQDVMDLVKRLSQSQFTPSQFLPPPP